MQKDSKKASPWCGKHQAFTLAEVLITLGIIGVVAAITIPLLVNNYRKKEIATRFEQNYNIIQNAFEMAQVEHGDMSTWEIPFNKASLAFFETYLFPNLKLIKKGQYSLRDLGYTTPIKEKDGITTTSNRALDRVATRAVLNNGTIIVLFVPVSAQNSNNEKVYAAVQMLVDLNGPKGPNVEGRDIFMYAMPLANGAKLDIGLTNWSINIDTGVVTYSQGETREQRLAACKNPEKNVMPCGALIAEEGWKIPDDYPFKL